MVDAGPEPTYEEKKLVSSHENLTLLKAFNNSADQSDQRHSGKNDVCSSDFHSFVQARLCS